MIPFIYFLLILWTVLGLFVVFNVEKDKANMFKLALIAGPVNLILLFIILAGVFLFNKACDWVQKPE